MTHPPKATGDAGAAVAAAALLTRLVTAPWNATSLRRGLREEREDIPCLGEPKYAPITRRSAYLDPKGIV